MAIDHDVEFAIQRMMLPLAPDKFEEATAAVVEFLNEAGIEPDSHSQFLNLKYDEWQVDSRLDDTLKAAIKCAFAASQNVGDPEVSESYFEIHAVLSKSHNISFELAVIILSHLRLIISLATNESMSGAKIAKVLRTLSSQLVLLHWRHVSVILRAFGIEPKLDVNDTLAQYAKDEALELEFFADADLGESAMLIGELAERLYYPGDLTSQLLTLNADPAHLPYLQILHFQCLISAFYNHDVQTLYEFSPRGVVANEIFAKWNDLLPTSNPILNNAKAVDYLDDNWARSRKPNESRQADALFQILRGLNSMGQAAAEELAGCLRMWLVRYIRINTVQIAPIPDSLENVAIEEIIRAITSAPTQTLGILEQRLVDVIGVLIHGDADFRARGLGDPVNVNNLSKRKLGDCDFQNSTSRQVIAYEAHGGKLKRLYLEGHLRTLTRALDRRIEELETVDDIARWTITVQFIAYGFDEDLPTSADVSGLRVVLEYSTFENLAEEVFELQDLGAVFQTHFVDVLNERRTPAFVRDRITQLINGNE